MGGQQEAVSPCVNENELVLFDCWGWQPVLEMEEEATEEGEVDDWFAEQSPSMSMLVVMLVVAVVVVFLLFLLFLLLELMVLFCEHCNMASCSERAHMVRAVTLWWIKVLLSLLTISIPTYMSLGKSERSEDVRDFSSYGSL